MYLWIQLGACLLASVAKAAPSPSAAAAVPATAPVLPFSFEHIFDAVLHLGAPSRPVSIPGGVLVTEPVLNGTVTGKLCATIQGGFAHPPIYDNGTLQQPVIDLYGTTHDGQSLYLHETGTGTPEAQVTRIELYIGGQNYLNYTNGFILASVNPNANRTLVNVQGFLVRNTLP